MSILVGSTIREDNGAIMVNKYNVTIINMSDGALHGYILCTIRLLVRSQWRSLMRGETWTHHFAFRSGLDLVDIVIMVFYRKAAKCYSHTLKKKLSTRGCIWWYERWWRMYCETRKLIAGFDIPFPYKNVRWYYNNIIAQIYIARNSRFL